MSREFDEVLEFARAATRVMAVQLQATVKMIKDDTAATPEYRVLYARILREQADLVLAAAEALERP